MNKMTLGKLAEHVGGMIIGDENIVISAASTLNNATEGQITFLSNPKYEPQVKGTDASAVIAAKEMDTNANLLIAADPYYAFMQIVVLLHGHRKHQLSGISKLANISDSAKIGNNCHIHPCVTIQANVEIGDNCIIYPGVFIGNDSIIGSDCIFYPNCVISDETQVGNRVIIQANAVIGQDGFGFSTHEGKHYKIPQIGKVVLEDDVEIGACAAIERGTLEDTVIGEGTKLGDCGTIGHGVRIGPYCLLVPRVAIAGSTTLGHHCVIGGQVGTVGHIKIGNMVTIGAQAGVVNDVPDGATILGSPAIEANKAKRAYPLIETLPEMRKKIKRLEKELARLKESGE